MSKAKGGDKVKAHFTGKLESGEVFADSKGGEPFEFLLGEGNVIPGFENGILGMEVGERKTITIPPVEAYGQRSEELIANIKRADLPEDVSPVIGQKLKMQAPDGGNIDLVVAGMDEDSITLDANHPLAGNTLVFHVELVEIA